MAFEGLFLEIINENLDTKIDSETTMRVAKEFNLDKETAIDIDFWKKLKTFH